MKMLTMPHRKTLELRQPMQNLMASCQLKNWCISNWLINQQISAHRFPLTVTLFFIHNIFSLQLIFHELSTGQSGFYLPFDVPVTNQKRKWTRSGWRTLTHGNKDGVRLRLLRKYYKAFLNFKNEYDPIANGL